MQSTYVNNNGVTLHFLHPSVERHTQRFVNNDVVDGSCNEHMSGFVCVSMNIMYLVM